jgi:hypothetical protein
MSALCSSPKRRSMGHAQTTLGSIRFSIFDRIHLRKDIYLRQCKEIEVVLPIEAFTPVRWILASRTCDSQALEAEMRRRIKKLLDGFIDASEDAVRVSDAYLFVVEYRWFQRSRTVGDGRGEVRLIGEDGSYDHP